jgi:hypothetical protein
LVRSLLFIYQHNQVEIGGNSCFQILSRTDHLLVPGFCLHDELRNLHDAGLTNLEVLQSVAMNPAVFLGLLAAPILSWLMDNPLQKLETLRSPLGVTLGGYWRSRGRN